MYKLYTDGACSPNPGFGGYGFIVLQHNKIIYRRYKGVKETTNNRMELLAVIQGLKYIPVGEAVTVFTDSMYVIKCATMEWGKKSNIDLWCKFDQQQCRLKFKVNFKHVKGHNGDYYNEMADSLAVKGRQKVLRKERSDETQIRQETG